MSSRIEEIVESLFLSEKEASQRTGKIVSKAEELRRLLVSSGRSLSVPAHAVSAVCVALACSVLGEAYVHATAAKLGGMSTGELSKAMHAARTTLKLGTGENDLSFAQMSVTFGCLHASRLAQDCLTHYATAAKLSHDAVSPLHRVSAFALAKVQIAQLCLHASLEERMLKKAMTQFERAPSVKQFLEDVKKNRKTILSSSVTNDRPTTKKRKNQAEEKVVGDESQDDDQENFNTQQEHVDGVYQMIAAGSFKETKKYQDYLMWREKILAALQ